MNLIEKILANHSKVDSIKPGQIIDVEIDARAARDFGGANVVKNLIENGLEPDDVSKTFFTFDCNPGGSDQIDALEWLAAMCSHVPNKGEQMVRYYGYYSNVSRGKRKQKEQDDQIPSILE